MTCTFYLLNNIFFGLAVSDAEIENQVKHANLTRLVHAYRQYGHRKARLDPLELQSPKYDCAGSKTFQIQCSQFSITLTNNMSKFVLYFKLKMRE